MPQLARLPGWSTLLAASLAPLVLGSCALPEDWDGDGFPAFADCDDLDPLRHPDAVEIPDDAIDQDCRNGDAAQVAGGIEHDCELYQNGRVRCQGDNSRGQIDLPTDVRLEDEWVEIAAGVYHTCALNRAGRVSCWGDNQYGQIDVPENLSFVWIVATDFASIGGLPPRPDGTSAGSKCWGDCEPEIEESTAP